MCMHKKAPAWGIGPGLGVKRPEPLLSARDPGPKAMLAKAGAPAKLA